MCEAELVLRYALFAIAQTTIRNLIRKRQFSVYCMQEVQFVTQFIHLCHYLFYITQQIFLKIEIPSQTDIFISIW